MANIRDLIELKLNKFEAEEFAKWAFGENFKELYVLDMMVSWNKLHGNSLELSPSMDIRESLIKMLNLYNKSKKDS